MGNKWIWVLAILLVAIGTLFGLKKAGIIGKEDGIKVSVEKASYRSITEVVTASGKVYPEVEVKISPDVSGEIVELTVMEGDSVRKGQLLARVYADILATQRDQAAAIVNQQEAQVGNATATLEAVKARLSQVQRQYERQRQLFQEKVISRLEFEQAENAYLTAKADLNATLKSIQSAEAAVASARASLQRTDKDLGRTSVLAPMDGVVSLLNVKKGERVVGNSMMAGTEMMRIADLRVIEVRVDVGESDIPKVSYGDTAIVEVDAYNDRKFKGIVTQISSTNRGAGGSVATAATDVTNYEVRIRLLPQSYADLIDPMRPRNFPFRPGMSASADIQTNTHPNVLSVPLNAVTTRDRSDTSLVDKETAPTKEAKTAAADIDNKSASSEAPGPELGKPEGLVEVVFILQADGSVRRSIVRTSIQDISHIEILSGLKEGESVVTGPYTTVSKTLRNGMKVKVVTKEELFEVKK
ncbi:MAG: efflux RND transporter periplasmic adaptor subunit [Bacteroidetes bacterium]|nr:efflux RND transporter periplasmic adaptor subunit [Bacteroidota bacterium]